MPHDTLSAEDFFELFKDLKQGRAVEYFNYDYQNVLSIFWIDMTKEKFLGKRIDVWNFK